MKPVAVEAFLPALLEVESSPPHPLARATAASVALLLVVAVGSNYALFFDQDLLQAQPEARRQTLVSLVVANLTTVCSFGVLATSQVPVLAAIGQTVGPGAFLALVFSAMLARRI